MRLSTMTVYLLAAMGDRQALTAQRELHWLTQDGAPISDIEIWFSHDYISVFEG